jgi:hypothetical protein
MSDDERPHRPVPRRTTQARMIPSPRARYSPDFRTRRRDSMQYLICCLFVNGSLLTALDFLGLPGYQWMTLTLGLLEIVVGLALLVVGMSRKWF